MGPLDTLIRLRERYPPAVGNFPTLYSRPNDGSKAAKRSFKSHSSKRSAGWASPSPRCGKTYALLVPPSCSVSSGASGTCRSSTIWAPPLLTALIGGPFSFRSPLRGPPCASSSPGSIPTRKACFSVSSCAVFDRLARHLQPAPSAAQETFWYAVYATALGIAVAFLALV